MVFVNIYWKNPGTMWGKYVSKVLEEGGNIHIGLVSWLWMHFLEIPD